MNRKRFWQILRLLFVLCFAWLMLRELKGFPDPLQLLQMVSVQSPWIWPLLLVASALNWLLESIKWRKLLQHLQKCTLGEAARGTLAGAAVSNIIPFRIGEYIGRLMWVKPEQRIAAAALSVFGSMTQMLVTIICGLVAGWFLPDLLPPAAKTLAPAFITLFVVIAVWLHRTGRMPARASGKIQDALERVRVLSWGSMAFICSISAARYLVFSSTYALLLLHFGVLSDLGTAWQSVALIFFIQSFFPSIAVVDVGVRVAVPMMVIQAGNDLALTAAALCIYLFNVLLPALAGLFAILQQRLR
ncbi:MAG: hypothetical protein RLZZ370_874 [Bacteroidota bacterium]